MMFKAYRFAYECEFCRINFLDAEAINRTFTNDLVGAHVDNPVTDTRSTVKVISVRHP